jgi:hypothetical protein
LMFTVEFAKLYSTRQCALTISLEQ